MKVRPGFVCRVSQTTAPSSPGVSSCHQPQLSGHSLLGQMGHHTSVEWMNGNHDKAFYWRWKDHWAPDCAPVGSLGLSSLERRFTWSTLHLGILSRSSCPVSFVFLLSPFWVSVLSQLSFPFYPLANRVTILTFNPGSVLWLQARLETDSGYLPSPKYMEILLVSHSS